MCLVYYPFSTHDSFKGKKKIKGIFGKGRGKERRSPLTHSHSHSHPRQEAEAPSITADRESRVIPSFGSLKGAFGSVRVSDALRTEVEQQ